MMSDSIEELLIGDWRKITEGNYAVRYPSIIKFNSTGVYEAPGAAENGSYWHGGDWMIVNQQWIAIQVANDAIIRYQIIEVSYAQFTLEDSNCCRFSYKRYG